MRYNLFFIGILSFLPGLFLAIWLLPGASLPILVFIPAVPVFLFAAGIWIYQNKQEARFKSRADGLVRLLEMAGQKGWEQLPATAPALEGLEPVTVEKLQTINQQQQASRQFTQNASHELQTPLAIIKGNAELLLQMPGLGKNEAEALAVILQNINRLSKINSALILLSKIENKRFSDEEEVNFREVVQMALSNFQDMIDLQGLQVEWNNSESGFYHTMSNALAEILVANVLQNAIRHNVPDGTIKIELRTDELSISNPGKPLKKDPTLLFERFYRESDAEESLGLGLSIVKRIADISGLRVSYQYGEGVHTLRIFKDTPGR